MEAIVTDLCAFAERFIGNFVLIEVGVDAFNLCVEIAIHAMRYF